ncbi:hypothetical protein BsWGS_28033 [Bradybaena similaris]
MDLGTARLRKVGINNLHCAVHPHHGVVWTDGKSIYLAPIHVEGRQVQNAASVKLGEFENVTSVHWSSVNTGNSCHMCVVHQQNVTVWRVSGALPKLNFKQVRKINVRPVPQGCLWNPCNDVLCLLSRHQCSFYFRHDLNKGSYAFPALESGSIVCGCWSPDGAKLIICVGTVLLIYRWPEVSSSLEDFAAAAWRIPGLEGKLTSIAPVLKDSIVIAAEVPLESLCKQQDLFKVPDAQGDGQKNRDGVIRPLMSTSPMNSLMNLQQNSEAISDSRSTLTVVHLSDQSRDPIKLSTVPLKGVLSPDVLMYEKSSQCVVVGSNSQSQLHIYALLEKHLAYCGNIQLDKSQRPKGLCSIPSLADDHGAALLILVGQRSAEESGLMAPSLESEFKLSLKYIMLKAGSSHRSRHSHHGDSARETFSAHTKSSSLIRPEPVVAHHLKTLSDPSMQSDAGRREQHKSHMVSKYHPAELAFSPIKDSSLELDKLATKPLADDSTHKKQLIEDLSSSPSQEEQLQVEKISFSSQVPSFDNSKLSASYQLEPTAQNNMDHANSLQNSSPGYHQVIEDVGEEHVNSQVLKSSTSMEEQLHIETGKHFKSNSVSERINSALYQVESIEDGCGNIDVSNEHMQKNLIPSSNMLQNSNQASLLATSTPVSSQTEKITLQTRSQSEIKPRITTIGSETTRGSLEDLSDSNLVDQMSLSSPQTDNSNTSKAFSNSVTDSAFQMSLVSSQTDSVCSSEDFSSLLTDRKPQVTSISLQTEDDSTGCFYSSSESSIKASNSSTFSQTDQDLLTEVKAETKSMSSQTEGASPVCLPNVQPVILETTDHSIQTELNTLDDFDSSQVQVKSEASLCLHTATDPSEHSHNTPSHHNSVSDERADILGVNHTLKGHDLGHAKEDTLSDFGVGSSQHSIDSSWEALEKEARSQKDNIDALHRRLELLSSSVDKTSCVFPTKYQDMSTAEIIEIYCEKPEGTECKKFLLDNGRLQLEPIKLSFDLATVELWLDGIPCVTGANIDGYIPLKFSPSTRLHITGRPANK